MTHDSVLFGETLIPYRIRRSGDRQAIAITVSAGDVTVSAPRGMRAVTIRPHVLRKGAWIVTKLDDDMRQKKVWPRKLISVEAIRYLGRQYQLKVLRSRNKKDIGLRFLAGTFELTLLTTWDDKASLSHGRRFFREWFRSHLAHRLAPIIEKFARAMRVPSPNFRILDLRGRWGSCIAPRSILLHWLLASEPLNLIEFVIAHEVCHLRHRNHGKAFYRSLGLLMPDWSDRHEQLQSHRPMRIGGLIR